MTDSKLFEAMQNYLIILDAIALLLRTCLCVGSLYNTQSRRQIRQTYVQITMSVQISLHIFSSEGTTRVELCLVNQRVD